MADFLFCARTSHFIWEMRSAGDKRVYLYRLVNIHDIFLEEKRSTPVIAQVVPHKSYPGGPILVDRNGPQDHFCLLEMVPGINILVAKFCPPLPNMVLSQRYVGTTFGKTSALPKVVSSHYIHNNLALHLFLLVWKFGSHCIEAP